MSVRRVLLIWSAFACVVARAQMLPIVEPGTSATQGTRELTDADRTALQRLQIAPSDLESVSVGASGAIIGVTTKNGQSFIVPSEAAGPGAAVGAIDSSLGLAQPAANPIDAAHAIVEPSKQILSSNLLPGAGDVSYMSVDPLNSNFVLEGLSQTKFPNTPTLNLKNAEEIAKQPLGAVMGSKTTNGTGTARVHPIQALAAVSITWLSVLFMFLAMLSAGFLVVSFQAKNNWNEFLVRGAHWMLLGGLSALMSILVW